MHWKSADWLAPVAAGIGVLGTLAASTVLDDSTAQGSPWVALAAATAAAAVAASTSLYTLRRKEARRSSDRVFIIYAHQDKKDAQLVADWLRQEGFDPWVDTEQIAAGQQWKEAIRSGLEGSGAALLLVTPNLDSSQGSTASEIRRAMAELRSKDRQLSPVIPVILQDADVPPMMRDVQAVSFQDEAGRTKIRDGLRRVLTGQ